MHLAGALWVRVAVVAAALGSAACAGAHSGNRFIKKGGSGPVELLEGPWPKSSPVSGDAVRKAAAAAQAARPKAANAVTIESHAGELRDALAALRAGPTPSAHLRVAEAYRNAGVLDQALDHFDFALKQDSKAAAAYDGRARIWREWGLPGLGMGDASRAVFFAPDSASARNTLGTLLAAIADCDGARSAYGQALTLDPAAAYARVNLQELDRRMALGTQRCQPPSR